jgi:hypothetical protein
MNLAHKIGLGSYKKRPRVVGSGSLVQAQNITVADTMEVGVVPTVNYDYYTVDATLEANQPPYADSVEITGTAAVGETLTATITNLVVPNGDAGGPHEYSWYRHAAKQNSDGIEIVGETSSTYEVQEADDGYYLQVIVTLKQTGVANTTGETYHSLWTEQVTSGTFNPVTDIAWDSAYVPADAVNFVENGNQWANRGTLGPLVQDGVYAVPVYNITEDAMEFTRATPTLLNLPKKSPQWAAPFEIYIRFKAKTLTSAAFLLGWTNTVYMGITSAGGLNFSGNTTSFGLAAGFWYTARIVWNGTSTTVEINAGPPTTVSAGTGGIGTGTGRFGSTWSRTNAFDGYISHLFVKQVVGDAAEQASMWSYFVT